MADLLQGMDAGARSEAVERLMVGSAPRQDFFFLIVLATLMASFGLLIDNVSVIIGSMLVAPLLSPIMSVAMGVVVSDRKLLSRSGMTIAKSSAYSIIAAAIVTILFSSTAGLNGSLNPEIVSRLHPGIIAAAIALVAGIAASYSFVKPELSAALPGVAVSVALIPPLAVAGIGLARFDLSVFSESLILFLVNAACIVFGSMVIFSLLKFSKAAAVVSREIRKEEKEEGKAQAAPTVKPK